MKLKENAKILLSDRERYLMKSEYSAMLHLGRKRLEHGLFPTSYEEVGDISDCCVKIIIIEPLVL